MTNVEALKSLYVALGGSAADVANASTSVEVLNAIAAKYEGEDDASLNPVAIANIAAVADNIGGGGITPTGTKTITENGTHDVTEYANAEVNVPITFRNFKYTANGEAEDPVARIPTYSIGIAGSLNATLLTTEGMDLQDHTPCSLPIINGVCEFAFLCIITPVLDDGTYTEASSGCRLTELGPYGETEFSVYKVSIDEDNANVVLHFEV